MIKTSINIVKYVKIFLSPENKKEEGTLSITYSGLPHPNYFITFPFSEIYYSVANLNFQAIQYATSQLQNSNSDRISIVIITMSHY